MLDNLHEFLPTYETTLPFSNKQVEFVPFKVKDAKNISIILQENDKKLALISLTKVLTNCTKNLNINDLCLADAEFLFLQIRSKSIEEYITLVSNNIKVKVNVSEIKPRNKISTVEINIGNNLKVVLETLKIKDLLILNSLNKEDMLKASIKKLIAKNEIYSVDKFVPSEFKKILDELPISVTLNAEDFIKNQPELYVNVDFNGEIKEVSGILNFFTCR